MEDGNSFPDALPAVKRGEKKRKERENVNKVLFVWAASLYRDLLK